MPQLFANNSSGKLLNSITGASTSLLLQAGQGEKFPVAAWPSFFKIVLEDAAKNIEIVRVTRASGSDTLVVVDAAGANNAGGRGLEGTTARAFAAGDVVELRLTAEALNDFSNKVSRGGDSMTGPLTLSGNATQNLHAVPKQQLDAYTQKVDLQQGTHNTAAAGGTADALTASYTPAITALSNGMTLYVRAGSANATTTPTFTPNSGTIAAKTIVKGAGAALAAGDIAGGGHWIELQYDATLDKWVLLNPATGVTAQQQKQIQSITATVASNALTLGLNPTSLDFRSSSLTDGVPNTRAVSSALSLVVPSGATLGTVSGQAARLALIAIDNAGTVELAVTNLSGGVNLDETTLISTTAISAAATSASVIYSTTARSNVPFRVVGFIDITEATAGIWATAPTTIQGQGGQALSALSSLGFGQTVQNVIGSRAKGITYYNTTGRPIALLIGLFTPNTSVQTILAVNGVDCQEHGGSGSAVRTSMFAIIPAGGNYSLREAAGSSSTVDFWVEIR